MDETKRKPASRHDAEERHSKSHERGEGDRPKHGGKSFSDGFERQTYKGDKRNERRSNLSSRDSSASTLENKKERMKEGVGKNTPEDKKDEPEIDQQVLAEKKKKEEEERERKQEEEKRLAEEEAEKARQEEEQFVRDFVREAGERISTKEACRRTNLDAPENRPDESLFAKLDSNLKKNTAFVRKLKTLSESQKDSLCKELLNLNLTKYIGEVAGALVDVKLKMSDVVTAVHICSLLHRRYADFSHSLLEMFNKYLLTKKDDKINNPSKYRVDLRFLGELVASGIFTAKEGLPVLANQLSILVNMDKDEHVYLSIITSFCKHCGEDYIGIVPRKVRLLAEKYELDVPKSQFLTRERQKGCRNLMKDYFASLSKHLVANHKQLKSMERQDRKIMQSKGEVSQERREAYEAAFTAFQKLSSNTAVLADLLDEDMPELINEEYKEEGSGVLDIYNPLKDVEFQYAGDKSLFEDEDTKAFYETFSDLRAFIPGILYRESENSGQKDELKNADTELEDEMSQLGVDEIEKELETEQIEETIKEEQRQEEGSTEEGEAESLILPEPDEEDAETGSLLRLQFDGFLNSLPNCVNRDLIDKAAIEFCMNFNTKSNRKKLARTIFTVHRTRYDLLPFYSRLVAILEPCMPELAQDLVAMLKQDFKWHLRKKDQINIESKLKVMRFIGELVKFKVCPKLEALQCLKMLMFDFRHHNIEMACALLESCGRFLYRSPDSHYRTKIYLEVMMRKKGAMKLESRYETMIENAFYYSNPPEVVPTAKKERPPLHEYIRKLLYKDLSKVTTEKVLRQMRKLNWEDPEVAFYATKCLTAVWNVRYNTVHCAANLLAGIAPYHEHVAIQVVDGILEDIRLGMEVNHPRYNQRRVACVKYLGELYNYRMVESAVIFKLLYSLITFGVSLDESHPTPLDPPEHLFRIRLVCVTLETCGQFFDKGSSKRKLDCFLLYFQRYYWFKRTQTLYTSEEGHFPIDVENLVNETFDFIRPKMTQVKSYEEACQACQALEDEYKDKIANVLSSLDTSEGETEEEEEEEESERLGTILEDEDESGETFGTQDSEETSCVDNEDGDGEEGEEEEDDMESCDVTDMSDNDDDNEDKVKVKKLKHEACQEDADFVSALEKLMSDTLKARTQEPLKVPQLDIAMPTQLKNRSKKTSVSSFTGSETIEAGSDEKPGLTFMLMTRKGNKQQLTDFEIPMTAEFAARFKEREEAERLEKEKMKRMVLDLNERQEEEEYQEALANMNRAAPSVNKDRKVKYQHPKGAPDADLIFGNKKR